MNQLINRISFILLLSLTGCFAAVDCICPDIYNPVCGTNGKNYSSPCLADCEDILYTSGECPVTSIATVKFSGDTLCGFIIQVLDQKYKPLQLDTEFKENGKIVTIRYRRMLNYYECLSHNTSYQKINILSIDEFP